MSQPQSHSVLPKLSLRRNIVQTTLAVFAVLLLGIAVTTISHTSYNSVLRVLDSALQREPNQTEAMGNGSMTDLSTELTEVAGQLRATRNRLVILGFAICASILFITLRMVVVGSKTVDVEVWIRRMGEGDLDFRVPPVGPPEVVEAVHALETLRQRSVKALQLDEVRRLSARLQAKNQELESVLAQLRSTQDQMVTRQKLVELGELTAGIAHEIRNPLNFIGNFAEDSVELLSDLQTTLKGNTHGMDSENQETVSSLSQDLTQNMVRIQRYGEEANRIVEAMLVLGHSGGQYQATELNQLLCERARLARQAAVMQNPGFDLEIREQLDAQIGDISVVPEDLGRAFLNIVNNACYATREKQLATQDEQYRPSIWLETQQSSNEIEIKIRDNGTGIDPEVMSRIFNPFFTTKPTDKGTGLGLSLCNDIVRQHGGTITATSEPGEFTEIAISLPLKRETGPPEP